MLCRMSGAFRLNDDQSACLDAVRGAAAIVVLVGHAFQMFRPDPPALVGQASYVAVLAFLLVSGFVIRLSLERWGSDWRGYILSRIRRILPPFILGLGVTSALWVIAPLAFPSGSTEYLAPIARDTYSLSGIVPTALFLNGFLGGTLSANGALWTLSIEVWLYGLALLFTVACRGRLLAWLFVPLSIALAVRHPGFAPLALVWAAGFLAAAKRISPPSLRVPILSGAAAYSYTLYVTHFPILLFAYGASGEQQAMMIPAAAVALLFARLCGPRIEDPSLARRIPGGRLASRHHQLPGRGHGAGGCHNADPDRVVGDGAPDADLLDVRRQAFAEVEPVIAHPRARHVDQG